MTDEQKPSIFSREELKSLGKGALVAAAGALLTYAVQYFTSTDFGVYTPMIVALAGVLANVGRKSLGLPMLLLAIAAANSAVAVEPAPSAFSLQPSALASAYEAPDPRLSFDVPSEIRAWYRNPDGSCVQCSIGMCGVDQHVPEAATLLWDSDYGPKERGGSGPDRVTRYCRSRGIKAYNVTGSSTYDWMKWACRNGRGCAIGAGGSHFQTLVGHDEKTGTWWVCNNNSTGTIDEYTDAGFHRLHEASGEWCVILDYPPHPARARVVKWWE